MSSLRPEEIIAKIMRGADYHNPAAILGNFVSPDGTEILVKADSDTFELGDWVTVSALAEGHLSVHKATEDAARDWVGVVSQRIESGKWGRVKTAGITLAKVNGAASMTSGDPLQLSSGQTYAVAGGGTVPCGRFLQQLSGGSPISWVHIGTSSGIGIHHHTDAKNTEWHDSSSGTDHKGYSWHLFKVESPQYTGGETDYRLMLAVGGTADHGETNKEGYAWGGVIGANSSQGSGEIGGNETAGKQGVIGAESTVDDRVRINIRSYAGVNARDRYPAQSVTDSVGPIRYTKKGTDPKWRVEAICDTTGCTAGALFWGGTMRPDTTPAPNNNTSWGFQWTPQMEIERDCCDVAWSAITPPEFTCGTVTNPGQFDTNRHDAAGSYEDIIPWGYTACPNRLSVLHGVCYLVKQVMAIWQFLYGWSSVVDQMFKCVDTRLVNLGQAACCGTVPGMTVPTVTGGPNNQGDCLATACD